MPPDEDDIAALLAGFVRRRPKSVGLDPLEILRVVTRDGFKCRICRAEVAAHPRSVITLDDPGDEGLDQFITVCDRCRLKLLKREDPGGAEDLGHNRVVLDPVVWKRFQDELDLPLRHQALLQGSRVILTLSSVEIEVLSEFHAEVMNKTVLSAAMRRLFQGLTGDPRFTVR